VKRTGASFPLLAPAWCECGCGWSGNDDVAQFCIEEALMFLVEHEETKARIASLGVGGEPEDAAGEIPDAALAQAKARAAHFARTGEDL
jgi:hypothetical protein